MKIAVSALGDNLQAQVDPRFGRAQFFIIVDTETMDFEAISNVSVNAAHGAGIQSGQLMSNKGIAAIITGQVGPNAFQTLSAIGIQIYQATGGNVAQAVEAFKNGKLQLITQMGPAHAGTGGIGAGIGRGMGRGMGRGIGVGAGAVPPFSSGSPTPAAPANVSKEQEIQYLKSQMQMLTQQLEAINKRISELEKK